MLSPYRISRTELRIVPIALLIAIVSGFFFGSLLDIDLARDPMNVNAFDIFLNNMTIGFVLIIFTHFVAYPIIMFNGFFLGLNVFFAHQMFGGYKTFMTLIFHTPLEVVAWIFCIFISKRVYVVYKDLLNRRFNKEALRYILRSVGWLAVIYLLAAIIEHQAFRLLGGSSWLS